MTGHWLPEEMGMQPSWVPEPTQYVLSAPDMQTAVPTGSWPLCAIRIQTRILFLAEEDSSTRA